jgi:hypothetical protein
VCVLHPPASYGLTPQNARILDLTDSAYDSASPFERLETWLMSTGKQCSQLSSPIVADAFVLVDELGRGVQVYIDALDVLVEDWDAAGRAVRLVKNLLKSLRGLKGAFALCYP